MMGMGGLNSILESIKGLSAPELSLICHLLNIRLGKRIKRIISALAIELVTIRKEKKAAEKIK